MDDIRGVIAKELEGEFRVLAMKKLVYGKGSISKPLEGTIHVWIELLDNHP